MRCSSLMFLICLGLVLQEARGGFGLSNISSISAAQTYAESAAGQEATVREDFNASLNRFNVLCGEVYRLYTDA